MKFSHKFLHTYCIILHIKKEKLKIRENRVVDMVAGQNDKIAKLLASSFIFSLTCPQCHFVGKHALVATNILENQLLVAVKSKVCTHRGCQIVFEKRDPHI